MNKYKQDYDKEKLNFKHLMRMNQAIGSVIMNI